MKRTDERLREYKRELRKKLASRQANPHFSLDFRDEIEKFGVDQEEIRRVSGNRSHLKVIVSAHVVETYEFEEGVIVGSRPPPAVNFDIETGEIIEKEKGKADPLAAKRNNAKRARNEARRLVLANFDNNSKFVTLTFRDGSVSDVTNVRECNQAFELFIKRLRKRYTGFKYLKVIEFQDSYGRGAVHYHFLSNLPYIDAEKLAELWGHGFVGINRITHVDNVGAYVTSYMLKDFDDSRLAGEKAYSTSKKLIRPVVLYGTEAAEYMAAYRLKEKKEVFKNHYDSEYQGQIIYKEYNLLRGKVLKP